MRPKLWGITLLIAAVLSADIAVLATRVGDDAPLAQDPTGSVTQQDPDPGVTASKRGNTKQRASRQKARQPNRQPDQVDAPAPLNLPFQPPAAGVYRYATESRADFGGQEQVQEGVDRYTFKAPFRVRDALDQVVVIKQDNDRGTTRRTSRWTVEGLYRVRDRTGSSDCTYDPPSLVLPFPIRIGATWDTEPTCRSADEYDGFEGEAESSARLLREEEVEVAGQTVFTYVVEETTDFRFETEQGSGNVHAVTLKWFSPAHRLFVKTQTDTTTTLDEPVLGFDSFEATATAEILNLSPR